LGYDLAGLPTLEQLLLDWRSDLVFGVTVLVLAGVYLVWVRRLRRRGWVAARSS
jgi:putative copper resistance protein D